MSNSLARYFSVTIRERGAAYAAARKVRIVSTNRNSLLAIVLGSQRYAADIHATPGALSLSCNCPYADSAGACKHLWALVVHGEATGTLAPLLATAGATPVVSFAMDADDDDDAELDDYDFTIDDDAYEPRARDGRAASARSAKASSRAATPYSRSAAPPPPVIAPWMRVLDGARRQMEAARPIASNDPPAVWPEDRRLVYILDLDASATVDGVMIELGTERRGRHGKWGEAKRFTLGAAVWFAVPDPGDRQIAELLCGASDSYAFARHRMSGIEITPRAFPLTLRAILDTGRCRLRSSSTPAVTGRTLRYDDGSPWTFRLRVTRDAAAAHQITGLLVRDGHEMTLGEPLLLHAAGYLIADDAVMRFEDDGAFPLLRELQQHGSTLAVPDDITELLTRIYALPSVPTVDISDQIAVTEVHDTPTPSVTFAALTGGWHATPVFSVLCEYRYGLRSVQYTERVAPLFDAATRTVYHRKAVFERTAFSRLLALGVKEEWSYQLGRKSLVVGRARLTDLAFTLAREGWNVSVEGVSYLAPGAISATVRSGIDWFDLHGHVRYGDVDIPIDAILEARRRGSTVVQIGDGAMGLMPDAWLDRLGPLVAAGDRADGAVRFRREQLPLLDALLATLPEADIDETFAHARAELASFARVAPADPPPSFQGHLREYQREGLGWLHFLRRFKLGGCLADDMGLGKTIQVLALLEGRRVDGYGPSIVVVPRSLVFNWLREAERFAPALRMFDCSGSKRSLDVIGDAQADVVIVTYGSLRRDAAMLAGMTFDYAILDEAQAIKNATTATAKATRLLRAEHRIAISGTPIENRITELWSLLEFLNPGMLGGTSNFAALARQSAPPSGTESGDRSSNGQAVLARALRPLILRRTKALVAPDLPERVEQTLEVEMEPKQRAYYESIRKLAQQRVMTQVARHGIAKSHIHILEALLRLRQAACHPALIDKTKASLPSAKLDALVPALVAIAAEGHKALVFSQFTELLALVKERLDASGVPYAYLDGRTRDRQARVDRFQSDADCPVFLISLKAGGHGLNLTAADYVYLLDPWWNPAVEAQAIDRAHRIGQPRRVIATRLVARNTIEAKILELQATKRALADAVLSAEREGLTSIGRQELELLLGDASVS